MKVSKATGRIIIVLVLVVLLLAGATVAYHQIEGWHWIDAFYFSVVTITTVGYGDFVPTHAASKLITAVFLLLIIPLFLISLTLFADLFFEKYTRHMAEMEVMKLKKKIKTSGIKTRKDK